MSSLDLDVFALPDRLRAKADPALIDSDRHHFAAIAESLRQQVDDLMRRLSALRLQTDRGGQAALDRDLEIHRLSSRLRVLRRFGLDLCLGRIVRDGGSEPDYIGRVGLTDAEGRQLLIDWRAPAAEPYFAATHAAPMGLVSRRRYRWTRRRITDYWDEAFTAEGLRSSAALDDQSAFIASLGSTRSARMRDVLSTIESDQDAIIRSSARGALVVDGGPGTGKTVVALYRAAYLLHAQPRLTQGGGGVLFVGPHPAYLAYVDDVLPSLGEDSVQLCTLRGLVPEGATATEEPDVAVRRLKASARLVGAIDAAVRYYEQAPTSTLLVETEWGDVRVGPTEWAEAFGAAEPSLAHNEARDLVWEALLEVLTDRIDDEDAPPHLVRRELLRSGELTAAFAKAWPILDPVGVVGDLWSVPAYLRLCAPWLTTDDLRLLHRDDAREWTVADLPYLDAARRRIGDPASARRARRREATLARENEERARVIDHLIEADDSDLKLMWMLRGQDAQNSLVDEAALPHADQDRLSGPFAHVIVDEAQELTDAQWQMLLQRCPSRSFTIVGDRAQARHGFRQTWQERLSGLGLTDVTVASLSINYRTPAEIMEQASPVIRAVLPDANVPISIRSTGVPVRHGVRAELTATVDSWLADHEEGIACVIGEPAFAPSPRVRSLAPESVKGLEFDLVVLVDPESFGSRSFGSGSSGAGSAAAEVEGAEMAGTEMEGAEIEGAVDRYVAMTRATGQLVVLAGD